MFGYLNPRQHAADYRRAYARLSQHQRRAYGPRSLPFHSYEPVFLYLCALDCGGFPAAVMPWDRFGRNVDQLVAAHQQDQSSPVIPPFPGGPDPVAPSDETVRKGCDCCGEGCGECGCQATDCGCSSCDGPTSQHRQIEGKSKTNHFYSSRAARNNSVVKYRSIRSGNTVTTGPPSAQGAGDIIAAILS